MLEKSPQQTTGLFNGWESLGWLHVDLGCAVSQAVASPVEPNVTGRPGLRHIMVLAVLVTAFAMSAFLLSWSFTVSIGIQGTLLGLVISTVAIGIVLPVFLWVDRLEAEPARIMWFAFLWGALISTAGSLVVGGAVRNMLLNMGVEPDYFLLVFEAPLVEEFFKGLGLLLIFTFARREFNGVVDGIAYAGVIAIGFAYVEDILYLGSNYQQLGQAGLVGTFVVRCLATPFAHPMFTVCLGIAFGLLAHRRRWIYFPIPILGYAAAVTIHSVWNASAALDIWFVLYLVIQVPLFLGFLAVVIFARSLESRTMRERLTEYGMNGWFTPSEVSMLISPNQRRQARIWAKKQYGQAGARAMRAFQDESAELAIAAEHLHRGDRDPHWRERERVLLRSLVAHRKAFVQGANSAATAAPAL